MPSRDLLIGGPLRTSFETVALDKAEAPGSVGEPTAGGRLAQALVIEREGDRIEHVGPVALAALRGLLEVDAQVRESGGDGFGDFPLPRPAVANDCSPYGLCGVGRRLDPPAARETTQEAAECRETSQGVERSLRNALHD